MKPASQPLSVGRTVEDLKEPVLRYLVRYVGDRAVAEDLLQETLIRVARGLPGFSGRASVKTWAFTIATRVAVDHFRDPDRRVRIVEVDEAAGLSADERAIDERLVVDEMNACVRQVIDSLPEDYRAALVLHDLEGLPAAEVAQVCDCSVATAKIRIHRARLRLRDALRGACDFYRDRENVLRCDRKP